MQAIEIFFSLSASQQCSEESCLHYSKPMSILAFCLSSQLLKFTSLSLLSQIHWTIILNGKIWRNCSQGTILVLSRFVPVAISPAGVWCGVSLQKETLALYQVRNTAKRSLFFLLHDCNTLGQLALKLKPSLLLPTRNLKRRDEKQEGDGELSDVVFQTTPSSSMSAKWRSWTLTSGRGAEYMPQSVSVVLKRK